MERPEATVDLSAYDAARYHPGPSWKRALWYLVSWGLVQARWHPSSRLRVWLLRLFGARIGRGVRIKPGVQVKYPWFVEIGDHCWIGEDAWFDSLAPIRLGSHVCVSQGVYLCTGNHDFSDPRFALRLGTITLEDGVWLGA